MCVVYVKYIIHTHAHTQHTHTHTHTQHTHTHTHTYTYTHRRIEEVGVGVRAWAERLKEVFDQLNRDGSFGDSRPARFLVD
jgi:hypothetical protein